MLNKFQDEMLIKATIHSQTKLQAKTLQAKTLIEESLKKLNNELKTLDLGLPLKQVKSKLFESLLELQDMSESDFQS